MDIAVLLSGLPPRRSMEDFFAQSREMYSVIGRALNDHANQHVKVSSEAEQILSAWTMHGRRTMIAIFGANVDVHCLMHDI